jgi:hypothetical protein
MGDLNVLVLTTDSKDGAAKALDVAKGLDRDGWIELTDYVLLSKEILVQFPGPDEKT